MRPRSWTAALVPLISLIGCSDPQTRTAPPPPPSTVSSPAPTSTASPGAGGTPVVGGTPYLGRVHEIDYPGLHMSSPKGFAGIVRGQAVYVLAGSGEAYDARGVAYAIAEICSLTQEATPTRSDRAVLGCYYDPKDRGSYDVVGISDTKALVVRADGQRFTFNLLTKRLTRR